ncbi:glycosyl transferase family 1 [Thermosipho affectus]|uniref:Glycosyl transferase family 1 n=1 Tax=Thermosipho affectus TaxID=660294 RepID=A0ABX3II77_9BACT|nr:glycosyltransferase [Thermosipho affectus]ONN27130.1 glycosyl transferase family 1 [Thermosipho affectus]
MKIFIIGYTHVKDDKRVFKTVELLSRKHEVIYQYLSTNKEESYRKNNITYIPLKISNTLGRRTRFENIKNLVKFDKKIINLIKNVEYDILYLHYFLVMFPLKAFKIAKRKGKTVVYDVHEYHPENHLKNFKGIKKTLKENFMWYILRKQFFLSDKLIFVSKEMQLDMFKKTDVKKPYLIVPNYANILLKSKKAKEIAFVGKTPRNIRFEKEIIKKLFSFGFSFKIIGMDSEYFKDIPHEYTSFLPYEKMMKELSMASFSLISYKSFGSETKNYQYSFPHKFFDSIAANTPVIVNERFISMSKEVEKHGLGVIINPENVEKSVDKIVNAYENYEVILKNIEKYKKLYVWDKEKEENFVNFVTK